MSGIGLSNIAPTGGVSVTISGLDFYSNDPTPSIVLAVACSSASWTSGTSVACASAPYGGGTRSTVLLVGSVVGTGGAGSFSFDGERPQHIRRPHAP